MKAVLKAYSVELTRALAGVLLFSIVLTAAVYFWPMKPVSFSSTISLLILIAFTALGCAMVLYQKGWDWGKIKSRLFKKGTGLSISLAFLLFMTFLFTSQSQYHTTNWLTTPMGLFFGLSVTYAFYMVVGMAVILAYAYFIKSPPFAAGLVISVIVAAIVGTQGVTSISAILTSEAYVAFIAVPITITGFKWAFQQNKTPKYEKHLRNTTLQAIGLFVLGFVFMVLANGTVSNATGQGYFACLNNLNYVAQAGCKVNFVLFAVGLTFFFMGAWITLINIFDGNLYELEPHVEQIKTTAQDSIGYFTPAEGRLIPVATARSILAQPSGWWNQRALESNIFPGENQTIKAQLETNDATKQILEARTTLIQKVDANYGIFLENYATLQEAIESSSAFQAMVARHPTNRQHYLTGVLLTACGVTDWQRYWMSAYNAIHLDQETSPVLQLGNSFGSTTEADNLRAAQEEVQSAGSTLVERIDGFLGKL